MDFSSLKRRDLQALCKKNNIPANLTNAAMADSLTSLPIVEGLEEFLKQPASEAPESPERSVITSSNVRRTAARQKVTKEEVECSKMATRTRCGTRGRAVEKTDARKTTATRTTRKKASQEGSVQNKTEKELQAEFEADMESEVSENNGLPDGELKEISEEVSGVSVRSEGQQSSESQNGPQIDVHEVVSNVQEITDVDVLKENMEDVAVIEDQEEPVEMSNGSQKLDFHSLSRRDLQALCKRNKIPANTTNAAMADALESLEKVDGLEEFLKDWDSQDAFSPEMSKTARSHALRTWTSRRPNKEPTSSKLITKSCYGIRRKVIEETDEARTAVSETSAAPSNLQCQLEAVDLEKPEAVDCVSKNNSVICSTQEALAGKEYVESSDLLQNSTRLEDDNETGNIALVSTQNLKQLEESTNNEDANVAEDISPNGSDVLEQVEDLVNEIDDIIIEDAGEAGLESESENRSLGELFTAADSAVDLSLVEKLEGSLEEDQMSEQFDSDTTSQSDESLALDINAESESESGQLNDLVTTTHSAADLCLSEKLGGNHGENQMLEKFYSSDSSTESDQPLASDTNAKGETETSQHDELVIAISEGSQADMQKCENFVSESGTRSDPVLSVEDNVGSKSEISHHEKLEASRVEDETLEEFDTESTIQVKGKETPLCHKSLRKLKRMLKEKLQAPTLLEKKMEKLTLEDSINPLTKVEEDLQEEIVELVGESDGLASKRLPGAMISGDDAIKEGHDEEFEDKTTDVIESDDAEVENKNVLLFGDHMGGSLENLETNADADAAVLYPVNVLLDNDLVLGNSVIGHINVEAEQNMTVERQSSNTTPSKSSNKTLKPLLFTPSKSSSKTPVSVGRTNHVLDNNKENIDRSSSKTEPGKINIAVAGSGKVLSAMSMGKLKKEFKVLQSEKKRPALQSRSENCFPLASP